MLISKDFLISAQIVPADHDGGWRAAFTALRFRSPSMKFEAFPPNCRAFAQKAQAEFDCMQAGMQP